MRFKRPEEQEFSVAADGMYDAVMDLKHSVGADGRLDGSFPLAVDIDSSVIERFEMAQRLWERRQGSAEEVDWKDAAD